VANSVETAPFLPTLGLMWNRKLGFGAASCFDVRIGALTTGTSFAASPKRSSGLERATLLLLLHDGPHESLLQIFDGDRNLDGSGRFGETLHVTQARQLESTRRRPDLVFASNRECLERAGRNEKHE
jgi:hypothetical protein